MIENIQKPESGVQYAEEAGNGPDVYPLFKKVSSVTMAEGMDGYFFSLCLPS